jgi:hypothetical protein
MMGKVKITPQSKGTIRPPMVSSPIKIAQNIFLCMEAEISLPIGMTPSKRFFLTERSRFHRNLRIESLLHAA